MISDIGGTHGQAHLSRSKRGPERDGSTAPNTHNGGSQQGKGKNTVKPRNGGTICPILLTGQKIDQQVIKYSSFSTHSQLPPVVENTREVNEPSSTFRTLSPYSLFFFISWRLYTAEILELQQQCAFECMRNPYIKKDTLLETPEPVSMYTGSSIILPVSSGWNNILFCKWLQWGLNNNIMTYTLKPFSCEISNLIMTHKGLWLVRVVQL